MTGTFTCSIEVPAPPEAVFGYFIEAELLVTWIGDYAVLDAQPGGEFTLDIEGIPVREVEHRNLPTEHIPSHRIGWPMFLDRLHHAASP